MERTNKTSVTSRREKVPLKGLENVKLLATLDILNPRPQEGLNKIFSSKALVNTLPKIGINFPTWAKGLSTIYQGEFSISNLFNTLGYCPIKYWTSKFNPHKVLDIKI
ncbi:hypothetical protein M9H77_36205 [Catharanthus roseus]|uniref:Uncharacterized protein n=1 Tax=Catharanthus roseus TaxID=4058 RepID=A0ACB9ZUW5_CATRO|nr:hypothetical protein M9H77_36205 [Catharanthus roseus]